MIDFLISLISQMSSSGQCREFPDIMENLVVFGTQGERGQHPQRWGCGEAVSCRTGKVLDYG